MSWFDNTKITKKKSFEPQFSILTPQQRKQAEIFGRPFPPTSDVPPTVEVLGIRDYGRKKQAPDPIETSFSPRDHRKQTSLLIPTTMPWTVAASTPRAPELSETPAYGKRKMTNLIPATMSWVTELPHVAHVDDFRRRRPFLDEVITTPRRPVTAERPPLLKEPVAMRCVLSGLGADASEKSVRVLLEGFHLVSVRIDVDVVTNACKGSAVIVVRISDSASPYDYASLEARVRQCGLLIKLLY